ncbi:MAG TPA: SMP-30/gluconolactonase/LRE family protein [Polyangia bacterium]|jgi:sugar lactone lactonase YvrE
MSTRIQRLDVPPSVLGEGPVWSEHDQCLYYVDIIACRLQAYWPQTKAYRFWQFDQFTGSLAACRSGGLILTLHDRIVRFDPQSGQLGDEIAVLERDRPANRLNDGKTDRWGRFWVGSMQHDEKANRGRLWCVSADGQARAVRDGIGVSNSIAFDDQRGRMYFADSLSRLIEYATWDDKKIPTDWRSFAHTVTGAPDGSCIDAAGYLWNAEWSGHRVVRYAPDGQIDRVIEMPMSRPSCCTFGGADYKTLFVTSARYLMSAEEQQHDVQAGSLCCLDLEDVQGLPPHLFAL